MVFLRIYKRLFSQIFSNKEKALHLACACVFLFMIRDIQNLKDCSYQKSNTHSFYNKKPIIVPSDEENNIGLIKVSKNATKAEVMNLVQINSIQNVNVQFKSTAKMKYILEVFGPKASKITSILGQDKFKECKIASNCFITTDENYFTDGKLDKFDAVVIKPGNLRADKVNHEILNHL